MKLPNYINDFNQWRREFSFYTTIDVRFSETDMFGHVNNVSVFIYFEEARIKFLDQIKLFDDYRTTAEKAPVVADLQCDYVKQIYFGEQLRLYVKSTDVGKSSVDIHYMAVNQKDEVCLTGRGKIVQINPKLGKSVPFDENQLDKLNHPKEYLK